MDFIQSAWDGFLSLFSGEPRAAVTVDVIVWSLFIGFVIASLIVIYNKLFVGSLVSTLIKNEASDEESALPATKLGCINYSDLTEAEKKNIFVFVGLSIRSTFVAFSLRKRGMLRRIVHMVGDTDTTPCKGKISEGKFYIPEDKLQRAQKVYGKKGITAKSVVLSLLAFIVIAAVLAIFVIPNLITMFSNFITEITPDDNIL